MREFCTRLTWIAMLGGLLVAGRALPAEAPPDAAFQSLVSEFVAGYTMGKLALLNLREDYKRKRGASFSLQQFHDEFLRLGPLPMPLMREAMLGERGSLF
jgi:Bacterial protein of unknown function (DUF885)